MAKEMNRLHKEAERLGKTHTSTIIGKNIIEEADKSFKKKVEREES